MYSYFVRHTDNLWVIDDAVEYLWENDKIGIHFPNVSKGDPSEKEDSLSIDPEDYERKYKGAIGCFKELNEKGGYIWAEYRKQKEIKIGTVKPNSFVQYYTKWKSGYFDYERTARLKTLQMENVSIIDPKDALFLKAVRPRQLAICRWRKAFSKLDKLVEREPLEPKFENLTPSQQETVCAEYLYNLENDLCPKLNHLLLPVGRTLADIDIYGYDVEGHFVFGQVTNYNYHDSECQEKIKTLLDYHSPESNLVIFCNHNKIERINDVLIIPISNVEKWLLKDIKYGEKLF